MGNQEIVQKLWNLCNVLRDDGITYHQYVIELTYLLFLKMMKEKDHEDPIPEKYRWDALINQRGMDLYTYYRKLLLELGQAESEIVKQIYTNASTNIDEPKNLEKIIRSIDELDWYNAKEEGFGDLYEGLLEKNASETKLGAGQYFTPRPLIDVIVKLVDPQPGERCNDPAAGTFGFMTAANNYMKTQTDDYLDLSQQEAEFQRNEAFSGTELVKDTHRLALMNALLHDIHGEILLGDTLSDLGTTMKNYDVVLTNPPFGTARGGERLTRDDLTYQTTNKQLNFLQHIYRSLKVNGKARAAVVLPDNVLFEGGVGAQIRAELMEKCNLHTILRLPTGIFYAHSVKTNVLFFTRGIKNTDNTKEIWVYDLRTNMPSFGKRTQLMEDHFSSFVKAYQAKDRSKIEDERWNRFSREEIRQFDNSLDIGLIVDKSLPVYESLPNPIDVVEETISKIEKTSLILQEINEELKKFTIDTTELETEQYHKGEKYKLPDDWQWTVCGKLSEVIRGVSYKKHDVETEKRESNCLILRGGNIQDGKIVNQKDNVYIDRILVKDRQKLMKYDVVIVASTGSVKVIGKAASATTDFVGESFGAFMTVLRANETVDKKYFGYFFQTNFYRKKIANLAKGSNINNIKVKHLQNMYFPLPPITKQKLIAQRLDDLIHKLNEAEEHLASKQDPGYFHTIKQAILQSAFLGKLI